jgi:ATP-binding cassette subfamily C (CFTR/MRP) protein 1
MLSVLSDALVALRRIRLFLTAEELAAPYTIDEGLPNAVEVEASFTWETAGKIPDGNAAPAKATGEKDGSNPPSSQGETPFGLRNLKFSVPKGAFVALVGRVGSGKVRALLSHERSAYPPRRVQFSKL